MKGRRYHLTAAWHDGSAEFMECPADVGVLEPQALFVTKAVAGRPVPLGHRLVRFHADSDSKHFIREDLDGDGRRGPAVVNAKAFCDGWDRTFGKNGIN